MKNLANFTALAAVILALTACGNGSINENVRIAKGETRDGGARSVNGNIVVGSNAMLKGDISSVNGMVDLDAAAEAGNVKSVNGSIRLAEGARAGTLDSVNGSVRMLPGAKASGIRLVNGNLDAGDAARVEGDVLLVNGSTELFGAVVNGDVETWSGNILITDSSSVAGSIRVKKPKGAFNASDKPRVIIGPDAIVEGGLVAEREIELYVHESATIGPVEGAEIKTFTGSVGTLD